PLSKTFFNLGQDKVQLEFGCAFCFADKIEKEQAFFSGLAVHNFLHRWRLLRSSCTDDIYPHPD
ncbi:MAG: hypothetical protein IJV76_06995, partial [Clostridia bacterium]|nr:hypothetical protein [Clostridia bacterium]